MTDFRDPHDEPTAISSRPGIPEGPGECVYPDHCPANTRPGLTANCPEHGKVPVLTERQWYLLNPVTRETPAELWRVTEPIADGGWLAGDVRPVYVVGAGMRWVTAWMNPIAHNFGELMFITEPRGWCLIELPIRYEHEALAALWRTLRDTTT